MTRTTAFALGVAATLLAAGVPTAWAQESDGSMQSEQLMRRIVSHTQGWGEMGVDVAAHMAGAEPMPLKIGEKAYTSGIGTHAPSETVLLLDGQYERLTAEVGVLPQGDSVGSVVFKVILDGEEAFDSGVLKDGMAAVPVDVSLKGVAELRLVVTDAGDGVTCDMANWANLELTPDPDATAPTGDRGVDIAQFAKVRTWDPEMTHGTTASRLETMPEEDLFPGADVIAADGVYTAPAYADGRSCIGLEWLERRRVSEVVVEFADAPEHADTAKVEFWRMAAHGGSPGGSRWQGTWEPMPAALSRDGAVWTITPQWTEQQEVRAGTMKVRMVFAASEQPVRVRGIQAYTTTRWETADVVVQGAATGRFTMYNGELTDGGDALARAWATAEPLRLRVRYSPARAWELADRTVLRFDVDGARFGVAIDDVVENGQVYVEHAGVLVSTADAATDIESYRQAIADKRTVLERVREMPDQTSAAAMRNVYRTDADLGPTMLSLAADNRKFVVERSGQMSWDPNPEVYNHFASAYPGPYSARMVPSFGEGDPEFVGRRYQSEWLPVQIMTAANGGVEYTQRTFVAPFGREEAEGTLDWAHFRPLGVAEFVAFNRGAEEKEAALRLGFIGNIVAEGWNIKEQVAAEIRRDGNRFEVLRDGGLLAVVDVNDPRELEVVADGGAVVLKGTLPGRTQAGCVVWIPRWEGATAQDLADAPAADTLAAATESYWKRVMEPAIQIEVPDDLINRLIPASMMHCMLAARNDGRETIAPWIGGINYGPLESEAHSILRGMGALGQHEFTRRGLEYYASRINDEGFLTTGYTVMGTGWHLWTLGEYYQMTRDQEWLRELAPAVERACRWIMTERRKTMRTDANGQPLPESGLMPPGVGADWEVYAYYFYLNGYYCAGLRETAKALMDIGWPGAEEMLEDALAFEKDIQRAYEWVQGLAPVFALQDGTWVPEYPTHVYAPTPIENMYVGEDFGRSWCYDVELGAHHLIPFGILDPDGKQAEWTINHMEDVQFLRPGWFYYEDEEENKANWFHLGGFAKVQPYYARTGEVHALRDDVKPFVRTYFNSLASLINREDLSFWEHFVNGAWNKTHETGYFLHQSRLMLVQERDEELWLAPFVPSGWMHHGMRVAVSQAPTVFGDVAYAITSYVDDGRIEAGIAPPEGAKRVVVRLRHPDGKRLVRAEVSGATPEVNPEDSTVHLTPKGGQINVRAYYE